MKKNQKKMAHTPIRIIKTVLATGLFAIMCSAIAFPLLAGLLASFRPGTELIRRGLSINLDFSTLTLSNYKYLFGKNVKEDTSLPLCQNRFGQRKGVV